MKFPTRFKQFLESIEQGFVVFELAGEHGSRQWQYVSRHISQAEALEVCRNQVRAGSIIAIVVHSNNDNYSVVGGVEATGIAKRGGYTYRTFKGPPRYEQALLRNPQSDEEARRNWQDQNRVSDAAYDRGAFGDMLLKKAGHSPDNGFWVVTMTKEGWRVPTRYNEICHFPTQSEAEASCRFMLDYGADTGKLGMDGRSVNAYPYRLSAVIRIRQTIEVVNMYYYNSYSFYPGRNMGGWQVRRAAVPFRNTADDINRQGEGSWRRFLEIHPQIANRPDHNLWELSQEDLRAYVLVPIIKSIDDELTVDDKYMLNQN